MGKGFVILMKTKRIIKKNLFLKSLVSHLKNILWLVTLEFDGQAVCFDELVEKNINSYIPSKYSQYHLIDTVKAKEPRIYYIAKELHIILDIFEFRYNGQKVNINGFKLKTLKDWLVPISGDDPMHILRYVMGKCNANCEFCFQKGNPELVKKSQKKYNTLQEISTRLDYYFPEDNKALFHQSYIEIDEVLTHSNIKEILIKLRKKSNLPFSILTNGTPLTEDMISFLKSVSPVYLGVSLNSANEKIRKSVMHDKDTLIAIDSLPLLKKYGLPYYITIAWWPTIPIEDIYNTVAYAQKNSAYYIKIFGSTLD